MNNFKIGQTVVHLSHGVGTVKGIEERVFIDKKAMCVIVDIVDNGAPKRVLVPLESASQRLRPVMDQLTAKRVLKELRSATPTDPIDHQTWNRRYRDYMERIRSGDALQIAMVLRSLRALQHDKDLSFGERMLMDQAKSLLEAELRAAGMEDEV